MFVNKKSVSWIPYVWALLLMALLSIIVFPIKEFLGLVNIAMLYLLPVLFCSSKWGTGPALVAAGIGVIAFDLFFVPPVFSFTVADLRYFITFLIFLLVGLITGTLSKKLKNQVRLSMERENRVSALYALSKEITAVTNLEFVLKSVAKNVSETMEALVLVYLPDNNGKLMLMASSSHDNSYLNEDEIQVITWVFEHGKMAGKDTVNFEHAQGVYLPMCTEKENHGVLGICKYPQQAEQMKLLEAYASFTAMAINRIKLTESAREALTLVESERLRTALFNSLSHDLRTPLASIIGAVTGLLEGDNIYSTDAKRDLLLTIQQGATRMHRFINNLLDMARLESGMLELKKEWCDIEDIVGVAISRMGEVLNNRPIKVNVENLPLVKGDFVLIEQVLVNLLDNALKYSVAGSEIILRAKKLQQEIEISITDTGPMIPVEDLDKIFDKFYRLKSSLQVSGTGLGLSICKGIIEAHGGRIWARNNPDAGVTICFVLPLSKEYPEIRPEANGGDV